MSFKASLLSITRLRRAVFQDLAAQSRHLLLFLFIGPPQVVDYCLWVTPVSCCTLTIDYLDSKSVIKRSVDDCKCSHHGCKTVSYTVHFKLNYHIRTVEKMGVSTTKPHPFITLYLESPSYQKILEIPPPPIFRYVLSNMFKG